MKYYIATSIKRAKEHNLIRDVLNEFGHEITYDWTSHGSVKNTSLKRLKEVGENMVEAIKFADFIVVLLPGGKGTHTELGLSLVYNKAIFLHSLDPDLLQLGEKTCAFYFHELITHLHSSLEKVAELINQHLQTLVL